MIKRYINIIIFLNLLYLNLILCDIPLINYIEPLSQNDNVISIYGRFFGKSIQDTKVEFDFGNGSYQSYNISEWSPTSLIINLNPPSPKVAHLRLSVSQYTINHNVTFMNPNCLGLTQCNGHGICRNGQKCECLEPWSGLDCSNIEGEDMLKLINGKQKVVPLPNHLNRFQTSIGLMLKEITINGYVVNSYLLAPSQEYGSINNGDFLVNRYKTNTFMSSADQPFNCDITLNHYLSNQTSSIGNNYIYQVKDGIGLAVIVRNFISKSSTNKIKLYLYPMISSSNNESSISSSSSSSSEIATTNNTTPLVNSKANKTIKVSVSKIDNDDQIISSHPSTTITKNNYDTVNMVVGDQKLRANIYDFGLVLGNQSTFNTSIEKLYNISTIDNTSSEFKLYSVLSITSISSKYLYFFSDYYPTKIEDIDLNNNNNNNNNNNSSSNNTQITPSFANNNTTDNNNTTYNNNNNNNTTITKQSSTTPKLTIKPNNNNQHLLDDNDTEPPSQSSIKPAPTQSHNNDFNIYESDSLNSKSIKNLSTIIIIIIFTIISTISIV